MEGMSLEASEGGGDVYSAANAIRGGEGHLDATALSLNASQLNHEKRVRVEFERAAERGSEGLVEGKYKATQIPVIELPKTL